MLLTYTRVLTDSADTIFRNTTSIAHTMNITIKTPKFSCGGGCIPPEWLLPPAPAYNGTAAFGSSSNVVAAAVIVYFISCENIPLRSNECFCYHTRSDGMIKWWCTTYISLSATVSHALINANWAKLFSASVFVQVWYSVQSRLWKICERGHLNYVAVSA